MAHARKNVTKNKVRVCSDANERVREHNALVAKKNKYQQLLVQRQMEEYRKAYEEKKAKEAQMVNASATDEAPVADVANA